MGVREMGREMETVVGIGGGEGGGGVAVVEGWVGAEGGAALMLLRSRWESF